MANVLSQNEIDELLSALAKGTDVPVEDVHEEAQKIKPYDFRTANKFSKDQMRTLQFIYENYANRLSTILSANMRTMCEVDVISVEEQTFSEFSNSMPSPVVVSIIDLAPLHGSILFEIMPSIAYEIISRLLGGTGRSPNVEKAFTEIELSILERILRKMMAPMNEAWEKIIKINASLVRIETSPQYIQIVSANEPIVIITMNIKIGDASDTVNLCIPNMAIQPISKELVIKSWYTEQKLSMSPEQRIHIRSKLANIKLNVQAILNSTAATTREVLSTNVGDVIRIDHHIDQPVTLKVEHLPKFKGFIGMHGGKYAVRISEILEEDRDEYTELYE